MQPVVSQTLTTPTQSASTAIALPKTYSNWGKGTGRTINLVILFFAALMLAGTVSQVVSKPTISGIVGALTNSGVLTLPVVAVTLRWVRRRVVATSEGLTIHYILRNRTIKWSEINSIEWSDSTLSRALLVLANGKRASIQSAFYLNERTGQVGGRPYSNISVLPYDSRNVQIMAELQSLVKAHHI